MVYDYLYEKNLQYYVTYFLLTGKTATDLLFNTIETNRHI